MGYWVYTCIVQSLALLFGFLASEFTFGVQASDVLELLQFVNTTSKGIHYITGSRPEVRALEFTDLSRNIYLPEAVVSEALMRLRNNDDVTFLATVRQKTGNHGTLFSFSTGHYRFLELDSNGQWDEITLYYIHDQHTYTETFPFRLANGHWHRLALTLRHNRVTLYVNCTQVYERLVPTFDKDELAGGHLKLYIGQRNQLSTLFMGALEELKLVTRPNGYLDQCSTRNTSEFQTVHHSTSSSITLFQNLTIKNKTRDCNGVQCPAVNCDHPVTRDGECCPKCLTHCVYLGTKYPNGATMSPRKCVICTCESGSMMCIPQDPALICPRLECPAEDVIDILGQCCPVCRGTDFCGLGNDCHDNATCVNLSTRFACQCKRGFSGNGTACQDIDECLAVGGRDGHHCTTDQRCENTVGSYKCVCLSKHSKIEDDYSCADITSAAESVRCACAMWWGSLTVMWALLGLRLFGFVHR